MVSPRDWLPGSGNEDETLLDIKTVEELDLDARNVETELSVLENELDKLDNEFREQIKLAADAPETQRPRHKRKAKQKQKEKKQKESNYNKLLDEYGTLLTLKNAKKRMESESTSTLQELDHGEIQEMKRDIKNELNQTNRKHDQIQKLDDTVDQTLQALTDSTTAESQDELDDLIDSVAEGKKDITEVNASVDTEESTVSDPVETETNL